MLVLSELSFLLGRPPTYGSSDDFEGEKEGRRKHTHTENETCLIGRAAAVRGTPSSTCITESENNSKKSLNLDQNNSFQKTKAIDINSI